MKNLTYSLALIFLFMGTLCTSCGENTSPPNFTASDPDWKIDVVGTQYYVSQITIDTSKYIIVESNHGVAIVKK